PPPDTRSRPDARPIFYDVWGDTVVTAHYVQSAAKPNSVYVSKAVASSLVDLYEFEAAGNVNARAGEQVDVLEVRT
ncbi:MAG: adenylate/guanylate cyclase domain-containing protein, partial [Cyanobacteria bacterium J06553_1]